ncbi:MAG TPA: YitT family protein [Thermoanaerobacterales bacterium]|nr:YitT family protein [Thermoanaerobacterales bacterium]
MKIRQYLMEYLQIAIGSFIGSLGLTMFLVPNKVAAGGVSGLATVLHYLFGLPVGWTMLALNIPLFVAGVIFLGKGFGAKTLVGAFLFSVFTEATKNFPVLTHDLLLSTVYGGLILGAGLGIVFRARGSTGGSDLAAMLINYFIPAISIGQGILFVDFFVIGLDGLAFNWELAMYSWIALFVSSKVIDLIQEGINYAKAVYIISDEAESIARKILNEMERGVTFLGAKGAYTGEERNVLMCVVTRLELARLKNVIHELDPGAFVIVHDVHEVLGEGFSFGNKPSKKI